MISIQKMVDINPYLRDDGWQLRFATSNIGLLWRSNGFPDRLLITFDALGEFSHLQSKIGSEGVAKDCKADHLHIASAQENWFQCPDIQQVIEAARAIRSTYAEALLYGHSMGAYGALLFSGPLAATNVVAFAPQISIDPQKVPFDLRFRAQAERTHFVFDDMHLSISPSAPKYIVYDPRLRVDRAHFEIIARCPGINGVPIPFAGHYPLEMLQEGGVLRMILVDLLLQKSSPQERRRIMRAARRHSHRYFVECAHAVQRRGNIKLALTMVNAAYVLAPSKPSVLETYFAVLHSDKAFFGVAHAVLRLVLKERPQWSHYDGALAELWRDVNVSVQGIIYDESQGKRPMPEHAGHA